MDSFRIWVCFVSTHHCDAEQFIYQPHASQLFVNTHANARSASACVDPETRRRAELECTHQSDSLARARPNAFNPLYATQPTSVHVFYARSSRDMSCPYSTRIYICIYIYRDACALSVCSCAYASHISGALRSAAHHLHAAVPYYL